MTIYISEEKVNKYLKVEKSHIWLYKNIKIISKTITLSISKNSKHFITGKKFQCKRIILDYWVISCWLDMSCPHLLWLVHKWYEKTWSLNAITCFRILKVFFKILVSFKKLLLVDVRVLLTTISQQQKNCCQGFQWQKLLLDKLTILGLLKIVISISPPFELLVNRISLIVKWSGSPPSILKWLL